MRPVKLNKVIHRFVMSNMQVPALHEIRRRFPECLYFPCASSDMDFEECAITLTHGTIILKYKNIELYIFYNGDEYVWENASNNNAFRGSFDEMTNYIIENSEP